MTESQVEISGSTSGEIVASARNLIGTGTLAPGDALPAIRQLAEKLRVNRNTVATAYAQLASAGFVETRRRGGTLVRGAPDIGGEGQDAPHSSINLASGNPSIEFLPRLEPDVFSGYASALYGNPPVNADLREWVERHMAPDLDVPGELVVTNGAVDALWRVLTQSLTRGDSVALENPGFLTQVGLLQLTGHKPVPVQVDDQGMSPRALEKALASGARAVIITPRAQNPTGAYLSQGRADALRAVLERYPEVLIIEDDHFSAASSQPYYRVTPPGTQKWVLVRSVSKFLGPDLRLALVMADMNTARTLGSMVSSSANWVSHVLQTAVANILSSDDTTRLLSAARESYQKRSQQLISRLNDSGFEVSARCDGLNVWIPLMQPPQTVTRRLGELGWAVVPSGSFNVNGRGVRAIRVTTAAIDPHQIERFVTDLRTATEY